MLACLYQLLDWRLVSAALWQVDPWWLAAALWMFIPQTLVSAWRWRQIASVQQPLSLATALRHTLAASALNLVVPAKLGDLSKGAMLVAGHPDGKRLKKSAGVLVLFEKGTDVAALLLLLAVGWCGLTGTWHLAMILAVGALLGGIFWRRRTVLSVPKPIDARHSAIGAKPLGFRDLLLSTAGVGWMALVLWTLHLAQFHLFLQAAGAGTTWTSCLARVPTAIFAGLLPVSLCGIGPRDATLVWQFRDQAPAAAVAVVGLLSALRYLVPGTVGLWFLPEMWRKPTEEAPAAPWQHSAALGE